MCIQFEVGGCLCYNKKLLSCDGTYVRPHSLQDSPFHMKSVLFYNTSYFLNLDLNTTIKPPMQIPVKAQPATNITELMLFPPLVVFSSLVYHYAQLFIISSL